MKNNNWICAHVLRSENLGDATEKQIRTYAAFELINVEAYLQSVYPGAEIEVDHETNGLTSSVSASDNYNEDEILENMLYFIDDNFTNWLEEIVATGDVTDDVSTCKVCQKNILSESRYFEEHEI
jgi:hypothetical protein